MEALCPPHQQASSINRFYVTKLFTLLSSCEIWEREAGACVPWEQTHCFSEKRFDAVINMSVLSLS